MNYSVENKTLLKEIIDKEFGHLNPEQREAVYCVNGPLLILAGAGSGKTTVLIDRIAYMLKYGDAYNLSELPSNMCTEEFHKILSDSINDGQGSPEIAKALAYQQIKPWRLLAITFTNKAAKELKIRIENKIGSDGMDIWATTFHSTCSRILRMEGEALGYSRDFTIYDSDDSKRLIKECIISVGLSDKLFTPKGVSNIISGAKDKMISPEEFAKSTGDDFRMKSIASVYSQYEKRLKSSNAMDFDDIIYNTVRLFENFPDILEKYQSRFPYILVDEYQDTNHAQYRLISLLAAKTRNLCVVGDDDQSIYRFRGANIENILNFESEFNGAKVIRLEQNYRSTSVILDAANGVISNNKSRKGKELWTAKDGGDNISVFKAVDDFSEAKFVTDTIEEYIASGGEYHDSAVLYRMNAQSNGIERFFVKAGIPYRIIGGLRFYERKEVKDVISYLSVINNPSDSIRLGRVINEPKRGIGNATLDKAKDISAEIGISIFEVLRTSNRYPTLSSRSGKLMEFTEMIMDLQGIAQQCPLDVLFDSVVENTGYREYMESLGFEGIGRLENIDELKSNILSYMSSTEEPTLSGFLEEVSLYTDLDNLSADDDCVVLMTMHAAKGLEFENVFIIGAEEGIFPGNQSIGSQEDIEEERRLAYVGITRAKTRLYITYAAQRLIFGKTQRAPRSRFVDEIPPELIVESTDIVEKYINKDYEKANKYATSASAKSGLKIGIGARAESIKCDFSAGDSVSHPSFGEGLVLGITPMGADNLVEISFPKVGTKKIMLNYTKLKKMER